MSICFPELKYSLNKTDWFVTLPNGSVIWFGGLDDKARAEKILGMEFSTIYFNEASELDYSAIQIAISRLAEKNKLKKRIWFDFNPPEKTHWSYWLFIKKLNPIDNEPLSEPNIYGHLLMNPRDNLDNIDEGYLQILERMPERDRERFLEGKFSDASDGSAYYAFDQEKHIQPVERVFGQIYIGMDFNVNPMTAIVASIVNGEIHVFDEVFLENSDTLKMAHYLKNKGYMGSVAPDSTGKNRKTSGMSDFQILKNNGFTILSTYNPFVVDRVNNINRLFNDGKIKINPRCKKLINDLNKVSWKNNKLDQKTDTSLTHISDCLGYLAWKLYPFNGHGEQISSQMR